jgi:hypothetical protein
MKGSLLAVAAAAVMIAGVSVGAVALGNSLEGPDRAPVIHGSSDQTISPTASPPGVSPTPRPGYPISRWRELQEAKEAAR